MREEEKERHGDTTTQSGRSLHLEMMELFLQKFPEGKPNTP
jgi:hypothetical protein